MGKLPLFRNTHEVIAVQYHHFSASGYLRHHTDGHVDNIWDELRALSGYKGVRDRLGATWKQRQWVEELEILDNVMQGQFQQDDTRGFYLPAEVLLGMRDHLNCTRGTNYWNPETRKTVKKSGFFSLAAYADGELTNEEWYRQLFARMKK